MEALAGRVGQGGVQLVAHARVSLGALVRGKRVAMEYSPGDAVPYLDRVPAGVLEMVRAAGATVVSSAELVTAFYATWTRDELAVHRRTAERSPRSRASAMRLAGSEARAGRPMTEHALQQQIMSRVRASVAGDGPSADRGGRA